MRNVKLVIGNKNYSSWSLRAWLALTKTGIEFNEVRVALFEPGFSETLLSYSPAAKVPVYVENGFAIWDTLAICEYLAETHPSLWPAERQARARLLRSAGHSAGCFSARYSQIASVSQIAKPDST